MTGHAHVVQAKLQPGLKMKKIQWEVNNKVEGTVFSSSPTVRLTSAAFAELEDMFQVSFSHLLNIA